MTLFTTPLSNICTSRFVLPLVQMLGLLVGGSQALLVTQAPLVPGSAVAARTAAPLMESGGPLRATSLAERRKLKLETGERAALMPMRALECLG